MDEFKIIFEDKDLKFNRTEVMCGVMREKPRMRHRKSMIRGWTGGLGVQEVSTRYREVVTGGLAVMFHCN